MAFHITHLDGAMESAESLDVLPQLLDELQLRDDENPDVAVSDEQGWTISVLGGGRVIFENVETGAEETRHLDGLSRTVILGLLTALADGRLEILEAQRWRPGPGI